MSTAQFKFLLELEGTSRILTFRAVVLTIFLEGLRRLAQCSVSETLKGFFFLVRFSFDFSKEK